MRKPFNGDNVCTKYCESTEDENFCSWGSWGSVDFVRDGWLHGEGDIPAQTEDKERNSLGIEWKPEGDCVEGHVFHLCTPSPS